MKLSGRKSQHILDLTTPPEQLTAEQLDKRIQHRFDALERKRTPKPAAPLRVPPGLYPKRP